MLRWFIRKLKRAKEEQRGFTLIELLVVVIIIGILAAIAIPTFLSQRERAWEAACQSDTRNAATAAVSYGTTTDGDYTGMDMTDLTDNGFRQTDGHTTAITAAANGFTLTTTCAGGVGTATYASAEGEVVGP